MESVTDESGSPVEKRSYDAFGQRRSPVWGQPGPVSFASLTTLGFTGHEDDSEIGLVNMKGRVLDPRVGRFLTTDPIVSNPLSGQSWNPYAYVENRPLSAIDPSGFTPEYTPPPVDPEYLNDPEVKRILALGCLGQECTPRASSPEENLREAAEVGAAARPVDVGTTGSASGGLPQPTAAASPSFPQHPLAQMEAGVVGGLLLGLVPFAGMGEELLEGTGALSPRTREFAKGKALGLMAAGLGEMAGGVAGEIVGGMLSATGVGAALGVPAMAVSTAVVVGGAANVMAGVAGLMSSGSGSGSGQAPPGTPPTAKARPEQGRAGSQQRLRQLADDPNTSSADRGWIKQEINAIERGQRTNIRNPPGKQLAHARGREAAKGYNHVESPSNLQDTDLHRSQHKFDDAGRANSERP